MGNTHEKLSSMTRGAAVTVASLIVFAAFPAQADRQADARAAAALAQQMMNRNRNYTGAQAQIYNAQRAATAQALGANTQAASGVRSTEVSQGRGAAESTTSALTQPVTLPQGTSVNSSMSTALSGSDDQASLLTEIALQGSTSGATQDAVSLSGQNADDIIKAVTDNSNQMILMLQKSFQTQLAAQKKAQAEAEAAEAARLASLPKKKSIRDRLGNRPGAGSRGNVGGDAMNRVPTTVQSETTEILKDLDVAKQEFEGRDNIAASVSRN